jgi:exonuclease SbcC
VIIQSLQAENILKYQRLELEDLPERGLIAVSGQNESGKSTIGETICFALFGRTFSLDQGDLDKLIRWGENRCTVTISFLEDGNSYSLSRSLDIDGNQSARLCHTDDLDNPIATGSDQVAEALFKLTAFGYEEFIESFYLAQREITSPHPHSLTLKTIAGISTLEKGEELIEQELLSSKNDIEDLQREQQQATDELESMQYDPKHLEDLLTEKDSTETEKQSLNAILSNYQSSFNEYKTAYPQLVKSMAMRSHLIIGLAVVSAILLFFSLALLIIPDLENSWLGGLAPYLPQGLGWVVIPAIILGVLIRDQNLKMKRLCKTGEEFSTHVGKICSISELEQDAIDPCNHIASQVRNSEIETGEISQKLQPNINHLQKLINNLETRLEELVEPIRREEQRRDLASTLEKKIRELTKKIEDNTKLNEARKISIDLLAGASRHLSRRFNHVIREHVGMTLPLFTEGRYEHLQIDNEMTIQVFSNEKRGYLDLDEISSGTQRQIMLAVRLALSQELASRRVKSNQFLILDEPFAFFDQERTINSLAVMPELSEDLPQIFVTSQVFPAGSKFAREIICNRETQVMQ